MYNITMLLFYGEIFIPLAIHGTRHKNYNYRNLFLKSTCGIIEVKHTLFLFILSGTREGDADEARTTEASIFDEC